jgi:hypothetical protein
MDVISVVANGINIYLPIIIVLLCVASWLRVAQRVLHALGIDQFISYDQMTQEMCNGGRALVAMGRPITHTALIRPCEQNAIDARETPAATVCVVDSRTSIRERAAMSRQHRRWRRPTAWAADVDLVVRC